MQGSSCGRFGTDRSGSACRPGRSSWEADTSSPIRPGRSATGTRRPSRAERARTIVAAEVRGGARHHRPPAGETPFGSASTYGLDGAGQPCFFVSTMAEHTHNLDADPPVTEETPAGADPLASGRVTLLGAATAWSAPTNVARPASRTWSPTRRPSAATSVSHRTAQSRYAGTYPHRGSSGRMGRGPSEHKSPSMRTARASFPMGTRDRRYRCRGIHPSLGIGS